jgi:Fe-S-cluster containining protein
VLNPPTPTSRAVMPPGVSTRELEGSTFTCLPDCGFCCTFPPEVDAEEEARLRARFPQLPVVGKRVRHLGLHAGCGACTLLSRKACTAYDERPRHCRYFPFHVHFGPTPEVLVNYTCRGVERAPGARLRDPFLASVMSHVDARTWRVHRREAEDTYAEFRSLAEDAGAWGKPPPLPDATRRDEVEDLIAPLQTVTAQDFWEEALEPFAAPPVERPYYLGPDLRWLTFAPAGDGLDMLLMQETGDVERVGHVALPKSWPDEAAQLQPVMETLRRRDVLRGQVYAIVDGEDYDVSVPDAWRIRLAQIAADLAVRAHILTEVGVAPERLADETARFYDAAFLDAPTIGGFL